MKVLFVLHLPPPIHGAAIMGEYVKNSSLINNSFECDYINLTIAQSLTDINKTGIHKLSQSFKVYFRVLKAVMSKKYDLCYVTINAKGKGFYKDFPVVMILKLFSQKLVYHYHNKGVSEGQHKWALNLLYRLQFRNANAILLSKHLYADIEKYLPANKVFYCANGIPKQVAKKIIRDNSPDKIPKVLFLSNMAVEKGVLVLLKACRVLKKRKTIFECHFVGGWLDITPKMFASLVESYDLAGCVYAHGPKYNQDKAIFFQSADIFVLPSLNEAFPLVNLEAMQWGLPVISSLTGGTGDAVKHGETGFVLPAGDFNELADKIEILIKNPELRVNMGMAGKEHFTDLFTVERFEKRLSVILTKIICTN